MRLIFLLLSFTSFNISFGQEWKQLNQETLEYYQTGNYTKATKTNAKALKKAKKAYGEVSDQYTSSLNNLAYIQQVQQNYSAAISSFKKVKDLTYQLYNSGWRIEYVESLKNIVNIYLLNGQYDSCEYYIFEAQKAMLDGFQNHREYYDSKGAEFYRALLHLSSSQASLYYDKGQVYEAIDILEKELEALRQTDSSFYSNQKEYRVMLSNLITYYNAVGPSEKSKRMIMEYLSLASNSKEDPIPHLYALQNLGSYYSLSNQADSAVIIWNKALQYIDDRKLQKHSLFLVILNNLGELYLNLEDYKKSEALLSRSKRIQDQRVSKMSKLYHPTIFNLAECYRWSGNYKKADELYADLMKRLKDDLINNFTYLTDREKRAFYLNQLSYFEHFSSFALEISGLLPIEGIEKNSIRRGVTKDLYDLQLMMKASILNASEKMKGRILSSNDEELKAGYRAWESQKAYLADLYEKPDVTKESIQKIAQQIEGFEKFLISESGDFKSGLILEEVIWSDVQTKLKPGEAAVEIVRLVDGLVYGALVLTSETKERPRMALILSTQSKHLEKQFYNQYKNAIALKYKDTASYNVYAKPIFQAIEESIPSSQKLEKIYFSPDGIFNQINLNTLFDPEDNEYVLDKVEIVQVTNTRELLKNNMAFSRPGNKAILFGQPSFSLSAEDRSSTVFADLAGTGIEVDKIKQYLTDNNWQIEIHTGENANEVNLKKLSSPRVLHLATHGFFKDNETGDQQSSMAEILLNSGIVLTGANDKNGHLGENGILTANEALYLSLDSTDLVVLSACESGLGQFHPGQGVYGLQSALKSAGAKSIIMSLWKVDDSATQELMTLFYSYWVQSKEKRAAFRKAQAALRKKYPDPHYWGAFVMTGL